MTTEAHPAAPNVFHAKEAARARVNLDMAVNDLNLALCWARRTGRCHAEIHGLIAMTRLVLEKLRNGGGESRGREESPSALPVSLHRSPAANPSPRD